MSAHFVKFFRENLTKRVLTAISVLCINNQIECFNHTHNIIPLLAKLLNDIRKWDEVLDLMKYALNNTICRFMQITSSRLLYVY